MKGFHFPTLGVRVEREATLLAIDDCSLPWRKNLCYYLSKPEARSQPVLTPSRDNPDAPDCIATHFYGTVLLDEGRYRMWYYAVGIGDRTGTLREGPVCYAESEDGIHWVKPNLGQVDYKGSRDNNAIALPDPRTEGVELIVDEDDPDPQRRYKMVYESFVPSRTYPTMRTATSPDGLHWTAGQETPVPEAMEQASLYKFNGYYFCNAQMWPRGEGGRRRGRQGYAVISPDFERWLHESGESFALPEPADPDECGNDKQYPQVHLGVGAASFGNVLVGLYSICLNDPYPVWGDLGLAVSNDGLHFREPVKGHVYISREDSAVTPAASTWYPTILEQCNGILNAGDETRIYHGRWRNGWHRDSSTAESKEIVYETDYYAEVALATLPRDRWGALGLFRDAAEGTVWSAPVTLPQGGCQLSLNADAAKDMRVEVSDERFNLVPSYAGEKSGFATEQGGLNCAVTWSAGSLETLGGETVRFRIRLARADDAVPRLYAAYLKS